MRNLLGLALLAGCGGPSAEIVTMEGFGYGWDLFNHRVSHIQAGVGAGASAEDGGEAVLAVVGGTSTTGVVSTVPETCDPDTCGEFPFFDDAEVGLSWGRALAKGVTVGSAALTLEAGAEGVTEVLSVPLQARGEGEVVAFLTGLVIDTDHATADGLEHCYDPSFGWHPRRIAVILGEPALDPAGERVDVDVQAVFEAGESLEEERACIDEINALAVAPITVAVTVVVGDVELDRQEVVYGATYACGNCPGEPDAQPEPEVADRPLELPTDGLLAWSAIDWRFHVDDPEGRGAYLRTLSFAADADAGLLSGHATNYSPVTQLSGFDYQFEGVARSIGVRGEVTRGRVDAVLTPTLDDAGRPVTTTLALDGG